MFVTFSFLKKPEPENRWQRIKGRFSDLLHPPQTTIERIPLYDSFFTDIRIGARLYADEMQQRQLRQCCRLALCAEGCPLPTGFRYAVCDADIQRMLAHILCNTAAELLSISGLPLYCRCAALVDIPCAYGSLLERLVKFTPEILIYTENRRLYQGYAEKLLEEYGAPVQFVDSPQALSRACLVLDTGGTPLPPLYPVPILSAGLHEVKDGNLRLWQPDWRLGQAEAALPPGINRYAFYAALHDRCRIEEIYRLQAQSLRCKQRLAGITEVASQILRNQSKALLVR